MKTKTKTPRSDALPLNSTKADWKRHAIKLEKELYKAIALKTEDPLLEDDFDTSGTVLDALLGSQALVKSCLDNFDYALRLKSGETICYSHAKVINKDWIHLILKDGDQQSEDNRIEYGFHRGIDVRISEIVWVVDAPFGS